jgi:hypothetical protein
MNRQRKSANLTFHIAGESLNKPLPATAVLLKRAKAEVNPPEIVLATAGFDGKLCGSLLNFYGTHL